VLAPLLSPALWVVREAPESEDIIKDCQPMYVLTRNSPSLCFFTGTPALLTSESSESSAAMLSSFLVEGVGAGRVLYPGEETQ
jgi:hypothetical protein